MKKVFLFLILFFVTVDAQATTYYASSSGSGSASCVDSGANVCTLQRAVTVASTGTHTIECAAGTYNITTELTFTSTNTGANITIQPAAGATVTLGSTGSSAVVDIETSMVSGTITFDGIDISDNGADYSIRNQSPEVNVVFRNGEITNSDASVGTAIFIDTDTTNRISQVAGDDSSSTLRYASTTSVKVAQKITVGGSNITVNRVGLFLEKIGDLVYSDGDVLTVTLETDNTGEPSGTPVTNGTSDDLLAFDVSSRYGCTGSTCTTGAWEFFNFSSNVTLSASTAYWIVLSGDYTASSTNAVKWHKDATSGGYAGGDGATFDGTNWTDETDVDYLFAVDRNHTRDLTVTDSVFTTRGIAIILGWNDDATITGNNFTATATGTVISGASTNEQTYSGIYHDRVLIEDNNFTPFQAAASLFVFGTQTQAHTYTNVIIFKDNTGEAGFLTQPKEFVRKLFIEGNDIEITDSGNPPIGFGIETDGSDPREVNKAPFEQIIVENNTFNFSATAHNHLFLLGQGSDNGILRNNTIIAPNGVGAGGGGWGIVVKSNGWLIEGNRYYGPGPAVYLSGTNHTRVVYNTLETYDATGSNAAVVLAYHQDHIYGGNTGVPKYNYVADNIIISNGAFAALRDCDIVNCNTGSASTAGLGRTAEYWSNRIDNNVYYARDNATHYQIGAGAVAENVTLAEGIATVRTTWESSTYSNSNSLSQYNDMSSNSVIADPSVGAAASGIFTTSSSHIVNKGSIPGTNIGGHQTSGSSSGPFGNAPFGN